jgi:hypothetical protein
VVFQGMNTQWAMASMGGLVGLRYEAMRPVMRACGIRKRDRNEVFLGVQVMEKAVLKSLNRGAQDDRPS